MPRHNNASQCSWVYKKGSKKGSTCKYNGTRRFRDKTYCYRHLNPAQIDYFSNHENEEEEEITVRRNNNSINLADYEEDDYNDGYYSNEDGSMIVDEGSFIEEVEEEEEEEEEPTMDTPLNLPTSAFDFDIEDCFEDDDKPEEPKKKKKKPQEPEKDKKYELEIRERLKKHEQEEKESTNFLNRLALTGYVGILSGMLNLMGKDPSIAIEVSKDPVVRESLEMVLKTNTKSIPKPSEQPGLYLAISTVSAVMSAPSISLPGGSKKKMTEDKEEENIQEEAPRASSSGKTFVFGSTFI